MKKAIKTLWIIFICLSLMLVCLVIGFNAGKEQKDLTLKLVDEVKDKYGNVIQQTYYNSTSEEYLLKEFTYSMQNNRLLCTDQRTTVIPFNKKVQINKSEIDNTLKIFYDKDFTKGPIVIMDNEDIKISIIKTLATDSWYYFGYELKIVNKSNKVLSVLIDDTAIMDRQCKPLFNIEHVDAGHTAYFTMAWQKEELERCYIPYLDNIEFMVRVFDNENWKVPALYGNKILMKMGD